MASRSTRGARGVGSTDLEIRARTNVKELLAELKQVDPKLATALRRRLRQSGDEALEVMREILAQPSPGVVTARRYSLGLDSRGRARRMVSGVETTGSRGRGRGSRLAIANRLKVQVRTGNRASSQGLRISGVGDPFSRSYNLIRWRHPVRFNPETTMASQVRWVEQGGRPYFSKAIAAHYKTIYANVDAAIDDAREALGR